MSSEPPSPGTPSLWPAPVAQPGRSAAVARRLSRAWWIAAGYGVFATIWIYFSDRALGWLVSDRELLTRWSIYKGLVFVLVTSGLLLLVIRRAFGAIEHWYGAMQARERELRASEAQLAAVIHSAMDAIVTVDDARRVVLFNAAAEKLFGCAAAEAVGQPVDRFFTGRVEAEKQHPCLLRGSRRDGGQFPLEASISWIEANDRTLSTYILRDISERQAHEAEIERLRQLYAALTLVSQSVVWSKTREDLFTKVCQVLTEQGGFRLAWIGWHDAATHRLMPVAMVGDEIENTKNIEVYVDERPTGRGPSGTAFRSGQPYICNDLLNDPATQPWRAEGERRGFRASAAFPIRLGGEVAGMLSVYADEAGVFHEQEIALLLEAAAEISFALDNLAREEERQRAEAVAHRERNFSDTMIESMPGVLYFYDTKGRFLRWNRNFETVTGYSREEIATMHPLDFFTPKDRPMLTERIGEVFAKGESSVEAPFMAKDGRTTPYFFTGRRVVFGDLTCLVGVGIDISERKQAEAAVRELNEGLERKVAERTAEIQAAIVRAEAADRIKSAFLATMSHELRTPLNSIIGFTGIILQGLAGPLNPEQTKQLGMVRGSARHLLELINDVLDISKIEAGQLEVRADAFDLRAAIDRVVASVTPLIDRKTLSLRAELSPRLGQMVSDRRRVEQILLNLLNNAVKFTEQGGVTLTAELLEDYFPPGRRVPQAAVRLRIADTGIGMKREDLGMLFQPFRQIDSGLSRQREGTGLGLAICRRLATLLHGEISATSEWTRGSVFTVILPLTPPPPS
ncbi:MAG: PAS domain S-box protein [Verrucomicrobia bacterium]|nr:PAS domain S-box protein [Verrucomicrobiota bacterium]